MDPITPHLEAGRRKPPQGVRHDLGERTIIFVTVCTKDRVSWLSCDEAHSLLRRVWREADAWLVGDYMLMPDHLHFFAAPRDLQFTAARWLTYWKSQFTKGHHQPHWSWQTKASHHRLRTAESYSQKWHYMNENPLRKGLVAHEEEWPFRGTIHPLSW